MKAESTTNGNYAFRSVESSDLPILSEWLREPHVARWYDDPDYIDTLKAHLDDHRFHMQLVLLDGSPIAYVQDYDIHAWAHHHLAFLPGLSRGLDTFIGVPTLIGKDHGSQYLALLAKRLFANGIPALGIDPDLNNFQARRAYRKVGFGELRESDCTWGKVMLMSLFAPDRQAV